MQMLSLNRLIMFNTPIGITHSYSDLDNNSSQPFFHGASFWLLKVDQLFRFLLQHARMRHIQLECCIFCLQRLRGKTRVYTQVWYKKLESFCFLWSNTTYNSYQSWYWKQHDSWHNGSVCMWPYKKKYDFCIQEANAFHPWNTWCPYLRTSNYLVTTVHLRMDANEGKWSNDFLRTRKAEFY